MQFSDDVWKNVMNLKEADVTWQLMPTVSSKPIKGDGPIMVDTVDTDSFHDDGLDIVEDAINPDSRMGPGDMPETITFTPKKLKAPKDESTKVRKGQQAKKRAPRSKR